MAQRGRPAKDATLNAMVVFVDARGFTAWSDSTDVFPFIDDFGVSMQRLLKRTFTGWFIKHLGDGAMMIREITERTTQSLLKNLLKDAVKRIRETEAGFTKLCEDLSVEHGARIPLRLGWGITKGHIKSADDDYIASDINKSARLCSIARPFGIVVDRDDFPLLPKFAKKLNVSFHPQVRLLRGLHEPTNVWVTPEIATQFVAREDLRQTPEVHIAGLCFKKEHGVIHALIARRSPTRQLFPDLYEGCGGQLARNELFPSGVKRHYRLELGIEVDVVEDVHTLYYIQHPGEPNIPGVCFLCEYQAGEPKSDNHSEVRWVPEDELHRIPEEEFIPRVKNEFLVFLARFKERHNG